VAVQSSVPDKVTVVDPGPQRSPVDTAVRLQIKASDSGSRSLVYAAAELPKGLSINSSSGVISGTTASTPETYTVTVTARDSAGVSGSAEFLWVVLPKVSVASPGAQVSAVDSAVRLQVKASITPAGGPLAYAAAGLPPGLSINSSTGVISGATPRAPGTFTVTVTADDPQISDTSGSAVFEWTISKVTMTSPGTQNTDIEAAVSLHLQASSTAGLPLTYGATGLPPQLSLDSSTGVISGTVFVVGTFSVTVTARDTTGASGAAAFTWTVNAVLG
jgi:large repetitive protein